jgi:hypothetical protein
MAPHPTPTSPPSPHPPCSFSPLAIGYSPPMSKRPKPKPKPKAAAPRPASPARPSSLIDTRVIHCGDNLDHLAKLPKACVDLIYIDPPFNSNRNYEDFWGETKEKRAFEDRHASANTFNTWP